MERNTEKGSKEEKVYRGEFAIFKIKKIKLQTRFDACHALLSHSCCCGQLWLAYTEGL